MKEAPKPAPSVSRREGRALPVRSPRRLLELDANESDRLWAPVLAEWERQRREVEDRWPLRGGVQVGRGVANVADWPFLEPAHERLRRSLPLAAKVTGSPVAGPVVVSRLVTIANPRLFVAWAAPRLVRLVEDGLSLVWWDEEGPAAELSDEIEAELVELVAGLEACGLAVWIGEPDA